MKPSNSSFRSLDELDTALAEILAEIRFVYELASAIPPQSIVMDSNGLATILSRIVRQLENLVDITRQESAN